MAKSKKYYVVWVGRTPGIFSSWSVAKQEIDGYPNAKYKSFKTLEEAEAAFFQDSSQHIGNKGPKPKAVLSEAKRAAIVWESISVDAACSGVPGPMEYRGVDTSTGVELFRKGPFPDGTNNVGEFLALVHGLAYLQQIGKPDLPIYTDSKTAMAWIRRKKNNTTLKKTPRNAILFTMMERAENWLKSNHYTNKVIKWDTKNWGEIPADFGRK